MTDTLERREADEYVIRKGGYYYRPNAQGYTPSIHEAGRYSLAEAISLTHPNGPDGPRDELSYMPAPAREVSGERARTMMITLTQREQDALERLMAEQDLSAPRVMVCALREYQMGHERRKAGETVKWSGDDQRAREFAALATTPAPREMEADLAEAVKALREMLDRHDAGHPQSSETIAAARATLAKLDRSAEEG